MKLRLLTALILVLLAILAGAVSALAADGLRHDRHDEFTDPWIQAPAWPDVLPLPLRDRPVEQVFYIHIENWEGGAITIRQPDGTEAEGGDQVVGHVLAPVSATNADGYTASGWAAEGTVCASAVNAIHLKTDHNYTSGRSTLFSLLPVEQAKTDPRNYKSYLSHEASLQTDIAGGTEIFGGHWAPLVGSRLLHASVGEAYTPVEVGYVPQAGEIIAIEVGRRKDNPEYIEFENSFGGLIWIKELGQDPYPIGQVLKPVVGTGRFLGTQWADTGRIRAAHPGVICISTSPYDEIGGFQIIPHDHAMSPEMVYTRYKTQWMVVGPLWALDESWEGLPPLFTDYLYPAYIPAVDEDGEPNDEVSAMEIYLGRFTVRGRYSDADDPDEYVLMHEESSFDNYALKHLTHVRIYFPRV